MSMQARYLLSNDYESVVYGSWGMVSFGYWIIPGTHDDDFATEV